MKRKIIQLTQDNLKDIVEETVKKVLPLMNNHPSKDDIFDLNSIPMDILDNGWKRYHPYLFTIDHRNPLANRVVAESTNYKKQILLVKNSRSSPENHMNQLKGTKIDITIIVVIQTR